MSNLMPERIYLPNDRSQGHWFVKPVMAHTEYVRADHIEALEARCRELEAERDNLADKIRWMDPLIKEHHEAGQRFWENWQSAEAHAQKLTEALEWAVAEIEGRTRYDNDVQFHNAMDTTKSILSLTPTSSLAAVRDEVREEYKAALDKVNRATDREIEVAAIRARKETGE